MQSILQIFELDSFSENILIFFREKKALNLSQISVLLNVDGETIAPFVKILLEKGYIQNTDITRIDDKTIYSSGIYRITAEGICYFDLKRKLQNHRRSEIFWRLVPIIISLLALMKSYEVELNALVQWLTL